MEPEIEPKDPTSDLSCQIYLRVPVAADAGSSKMVIFQDDNDNG